MIETSELNVGGKGLSTSGMEKDGTAASQKGGTGGGLTGVDAEALKEGDIDIPSPTIPQFSADADGGATSVGDIYTFGGFLGRPQGTQR
jgi:hypothetical protein